MIEYTGYAILVVNSYVNKNVKYPQIKGSVFDERNLSRTLKEVGFFVVSLFGAKYDDFQLLLKKLNYSITRRQYPCILFIFSGYQDERRLIFEDGFGVDYQSIFNDLVDPLTAWAKIPKIIIVNTYKPIRPASVKSFFGIKSQTLPFCKSPFCLTMQIVHGVGAAEKRGPSIQDTFVSKFTAELILSNSRIPAKVRSSNDISSILKHVYHSIVTESNISELNLRVQLDDQLPNSISIQEPPKENETESTPLPEEASDIFEDNHTHLSASASFQTVYNSLLDHEWFHGGLTRDKSEAMLDYEGDFLVRQSLSPDSYGQLVLSVLYRDLLYQIPLLLSHSGINIKNEPIFASVGELIDYYLNNSHIIPCHDTYVRITRAIHFQTQKILPKESRTIDRYQNTSNTWMHGAVTKQYVQNCLKNEGDFLVWEAESQHILSFVFKEQIQCIYANSTREGTITTDLIAGEFDDLNDLIQHLLLHYSYYRGVYLKTPVPVSNDIFHFQTHSVAYNYKASHSNPLITQSNKDILDELVQNPIRLIDKSLSLTKQVWFSSFLTCEAASELLLFDGDFLVRTSQSRPGNLSLSVRAGKSVQTFGLFIQGNPTKYTLDPHSRITFCDVVDLIDYYMRNALPLPVSVGPKTFLIQPINILSVLHSRNHK